MQDKKSERRGTKRDAKSRAGATPTAARRAPPKVPPCTPVPAPRSFTGIKAKTERDRVGSCGRRGFPLLMDAVRLVVGMRWSGLLVLAAAVHHAHAGPRPAPAGGTAMERWWLQALAVVGRPLVCRLTSPNEPSRPRNSRRQLTCHMPTLRCALREQRMQGRALSLLTTHTVCRRLVVPCHESHGTCQCL